jgi:hypothetical protein
MERNSNWGNFASNQLHMGVADEPLKPSEELEDISDMCK